jgi:hypothetical protein
MRLLEQYSLPLRWDNLISGSEWKGGTQPRFQSSLRLHTLRLRLGKPAWFQTPPAAVLRLRQPHRPPDPAEFNVSISIGSALFRSLTPIVTSDAHSLLYVLNEHEPALVRIALARVAGPAVDIALFLSRHEPLGPLAPGRQELALPGTVRQIGSEGEANTTMTA